MYSAGAKRLLRIVQYLFEHLLSLLMIAKRQTLRNIESKRHAETMEIGGLLGKVLSQARRCRGNTLRNLKFNEEFAYWAKIPELILSCRNISHHLLTGEVLERGSKPPHPAIIEVEGRQKGACSMARMFELTALNSPRSYRLDRSGNE